MSNLAYAVLSAYYGLNGGRLHKMGVKSSDVIITSVGAPMLGDANFVREVGALKLKGFYRLTNGDDMVPRFPLNPGYQYFGGEVYVDPSVSPTPMICANQPLMQSDGSCFHRYSAFDDIMEGVPMLRKAHLFYLGIKVNCRDGERQGMS